MEEPPIPPPGSMPPRLPTPPILNVVVEEAVKPAPPRKRKKPEDGTEVQPRRLRRLHEACARCRRKKIKVSFASYLFMPRRCQVFYERLLMHNLLLVSVRFQTS